MLKLHVTLCVVCGKFNRQVMDSQDMCRNYKKNEHLLESTRCKLDKDKKNDLKRILSEQNELQNKK